MYRHRVILATAAFALLVLSISGCGTTPQAGGPAEQPAPAAATVDIREMNFDPPSVEIKAGESVTWTNSDAVPHVVKGADGVASATLNQGDSYSRAFDTAGTFAYSCGIHPAMKGTVVVK
jgi:amicyanin